MASSKRKFDLFDPNRSDSDDLDYGAESSPRAKPQSRSRKPKSDVKRPIKRRRERYNDSDGEILADSDGDSDEGSFEQSSAEEEELETNPRTGRSVRATAKKPVKYEEPSDDEIEDDELARSPAHRITSKVRLRKPEKKPSLVVKLKIPASKMDEARSTRTRTGSRGGSRPGSRRDPTPTSGSAFATRRSSRISHNDEEPLVSLTDSGRHEQVTRAGSSEPPPSRRPTRGSKGLKTVPSAILETSQEDQEALPPSAEGGDFMAELHELAAADPEAEVQRTTPGGEEAPADDEIAMEVIDEDEQVVEESVDDEDDVAPVQRSSRTTRKRKASTPPTSQPPRRSLRQRKSGGVEQSSDFEPEGEGDADVEEDISESDDHLKVPRGRSSNDESAAGSRRSGRVKRLAASQRSRSRRQKSDDDDLDPEEIADEAADLEADNKRKRRERRRAPNEISFEPKLRNRSNKPDYRVYRPELLNQQDDDDAPIAGPSQTPQRNRRTGGGIYRSLFSTFGPFGGAGGPPPVLGGPSGTGATAGVDSDSSDDEAGGTRGGQQGFGGTVGMTPTSAFPKPYTVPQALNSDPIQGAGGGPPGLGKVKDKRLLADADPLGVDPTVSFEGVGGLDDHINQLKEMVALPLLYPEVFLRFHVTPPRGVLFHGPPGTGKTLLARALASSVSSQGKKVTFYMRKGADALSKWVGEAEKQLRLLFEEARKNQPSIIFFDEIDGLAPVRSSKQEQIHASIVATLLALMDGMDGRGQVIVIGATNRPDSVDPALRRPGRFDREFYFPLPDQKARRSIIDIHTKGWDPELKPAFKEQLAEVTRGYGGADLRALCTEAALNAVQGTYPQIYSSNAKLLIDPSTIKVLAKDFMISVNKIVPASERSAASGAAPLRKDVEPLLRKPLSTITNLVNNAIPRKQKVTALEEAMYDDREDDRGFERENLKRQFESARVFRPRLLIRGTQGMGQQYLGAALLSKLEGLHVQNFDLATLQKDSTRSVEAAIVQQFEEVKRHKPSIIYIPNVEIWYRTLGESAIRTFTGLLRSLPPTEPVLLLGILEKVPEDGDDNVKDQHAVLQARMVRELFGYSLKDQFELKQPDGEARLEFFTATIDYIRKTPLEYPEDGASRKKRQLPELPVAPPAETPAGPSKADLKEQKKKDRQTLNMLKLQIQFVMDHIKTKYKKFRSPPIEDRDIIYLYDEQDPGVLTTDLNEEQRREQQLFRPYELSKDDKGVGGIVEVATGKFYYNLEIITIEKRLSNGYYKRPTDFLADIKRLVKDAVTLGDQDRTLKAKEMHANVEVDMTTLEQTQPALCAECEAVYTREQERERDRLLKVREAERQGEDVPKVVPNVPPPNASKTTTETSGPVNIGPEVPGGRPPFLYNTPSRLYWPNPESRSMTNGSVPSYQTNGSTVPSRPREDSEMMDTQHDAPEQHGQQQQGSPTSPSQPNTQGQLSQRSAHTRIPPGSQLDQLHNSASTTTSGNKTSDKSHRSSEPSVNTQLSNGVRHADLPYFTSLQEVQGGSQLPDTQEQQYASSQSQPSQSSQAMGPPQNHRQASIPNLLNDPLEGAENKSGPPTASSMLLDTNYCDKILSEVVQRSSGLSVEQLEQVNASMMDVIWRDRGNWNRNQVLHMVQQAFNDTIADIEQCQKLMDPSQRDD